MFTVTPAAASQIRRAAADGGMAELALRVAARAEPDGSITYGMGFDEPKAGEQPSLQADGVTVLIASTSRALLQDTQLDFVELTPGEFNFIFVPQRAPSQGQGGCGSTGCGSGACGARGAC
jgi:iron-sulfur cluster assembly protein